MELARGVGEEISRDEPPAASSSSGILGVYQDLRGRHAQFVMDENGSRLWTLQDEVCLFETLEPNFYHTYVLMQSEVVMDYNRFLRRPVCATPCENNMKECQIFWQIVSELRDQNSNRCLTMSPFVV